MVLTTGLLLALRLASAAIAAPGEPVPNWSAPETWTPVHSNSTLAAQAATDPLPFVAVAPCRGADTRGNSFTGPFGPPSLAGSSTRTFRIAGFCGVPATAAAVSLNFTVTNNPTFGDIRVFPEGGSVLVSTLNWGPRTGSVANAAVVQLSPAGLIAVQVDGPGPLDLIYDINGYYAPAPAGGVVDSSRRAILEQLWTPQNPVNLGLTALGALPSLLKFDGADLWVGTGQTISRVRASDGKLLETWTGAADVTGVLVAMGKVFAASGGNPGKLYRLDPSQPAGTVTTVASNLGNLAVGIAFDGSRIWTANGSGSVSIVTPGPTLPFTVVNVTAGFTAPFGILYDGANIWVADGGAGLLKLSASGAILQTVDVGSGTAFPAFDGANIWLPRSADASVTVVRASTGAVLATLTGNGLDGAQGPRPQGPIAAAFDGQRVMITVPGADGVSLWRAQDLAPLGFFSTGVGTRPIGVSSDGVNFWIAIAIDRLARF